MNTEQPEIPLRHDAVTIPCPRCGQPFVPTGKRRYCTDACKAAATTPPPHPSHSRQHDPANRSPSTNATPAGPGPSANNAARTAEPSCAASASAATARIATNPSPSPTYSTRRWNTEPQQMTQRDSGPSRGVNFQPLKGGQFSAVVDRTWPIVEIWRRRRPYALSKSRLSLPERPGRVGGHRRSLASRPAAGAVT
jgi:hypothetical protein